MAAFASRYARAFLDVVTSAHLDTAAIDHQLATLKPRGTAVRNCRRSFRIRRFRRCRKWRFSTS